MIDDKGLCRHALAIDVLLGQGPSARFGLDAADILLSTSRVLL